MRKAKRQPTTWKAGTAKRLTWHDLVRKVFLKATVSDAEALLWNCSAFPFAGPALVKRQIRAALKHGGGTVKGALKWSDEQLAKGMTRFIRKP